MMDEARLCAQRFIAQTIRAVLREAASEALRRLLMDRWDIINKQLREVDNDGDDDDETSRTLDELPVYPSDIDHSYEVAVKLGKKWEHKLSEAGEYDSASIVRHVLRTGHFLEVDVVDEFPIPTVRSRTTDDDHDDDDQNTAQSNANQALISRLQGPTSLNLNLDNDHKLIPWATLHNLGWRWDFSQSIHEAFPSESKPSSEQWNALPAYKQDSSGLHIPKATMLPTHEIKVQSPHQLYGYPSPSFHMSYIRPSPMDTSSNYHGRDTGFYRDQIDLIDAAFSDADQRDRPTAWYHGWDCIQRAAQKNKDRMYLETISGRKRKNPSNLGLLEDEQHQIIPKAIITQDAIALTTIQQTQEENDSIPTTTETENMHVSTNISLQETHPSMNEFKIVPIVQIISSRQRVVHLNRQHSLLQNASMPEMQPIVNLQLDSTIPQQPLSLSSESWTMEEITNNMSEVDKMTLNTLIHDDLADEYMNESQYHHIQGALKHLGLIHLWEQNRLGNIDSLKEIFDTSLNPEDKKPLIKKRTQMVKRARMMRLLPHTVERQDRMGDKQPRSKVVWSESVTTDSHEYWMELDLGECMLQMARTSDHGSILKTSMAFRSLEISALVQK